MKKLLALSVMGVLTLCSFTTSTKEAKKEKAVKYTVYFHCSNGASGSFECYNCGPAQWQSGANTMCTIASGF